MIKPALLIISILVLMGCAQSRQSSPTPTTYPSKRQPPSQPPMYAEEMLKRPYPVTPEAKMEEAHKLVKHSKEYLGLANDSRVSTPSQIKAMKAMEFEMNMGGALMMEAGGDYVKREQIREAREVYWEVLRTFTADAYMSLRRKAETELKYLDDQEKRKTPPPQ